MSEVFLQASRLKLRFNSPQGLLSVEDLWDLPLVDPGGKKANLDDIAIELDRQLQGAKTSFVDRDAVKKEHQIARMKFNIVLHIIEVRKAEVELANTKATNAARKQQLLGILAQKENDALAGKSTDELRQLISEL